MTDRFQQNAVSSAIWRWQTPAGAGCGAAAPKDRTLLKAGGQVLIMTIVSLLFLRFGHRVASLLLFCLATYVLTTALFFRKAYKAFERGVGIFARWVGVALTWLLLVPFFYLAFVPGRIALALRGKDPMTRRFPSDEPTYWVDWPKSDAARYRKQFR